MKSKRILVNDLDNTTFGLPQFKKGDGFKEAPAHLLSQKLIQRTKEEKYDGFYACTMRCQHGIAAVIKLYVTMLETSKNYSNQSLKFSHDCANLNAFNADDAFTGKIVGNFSEATKLPMFALSTPEDQDGACGLGYENTIKIFEEKVLQTRSSVEEKRTILLVNNQYVWEREQDLFRSTKGGTAKQQFMLNGKWTCYDFNQPDLMFQQTPIPHEKVNIESKNKQLLSIARDAIERFPDVEEIVMDFIDDSKDIVKNALLMRDQLEELDWPKKVIMNIFSCDAYTEADITLCGTIERTAMKTAKLKEKTFAETTNESPSFAMKSSPFANKLTSEGKVFDMPQNYSPSMFSLTTQNEVKLVLDKLVDEVCIKYN